MTNRRRLLSAKNKVQTSTSSEPGPHGQTSTLSEPGPHGQTSTLSEPGPHGQTISSCDLGPHGKILYLSQGLIHKTTKMSNHQQFDPRKFLGDVQKQIIN